MESVHCCCFSSDGSLLATGSWDGDVRLWETATWNCAATLSGHTGQIRWCDCGSQCESVCSLLASASADRTVRLWDRNSHQCVAELVGHTADVNCAKFAVMSSDIVRVISTSDDLSLIHI